MPQRILDNSFIYFRKTLQDVYDRLNDPDDYDVQLSKRMVQIWTGDTTRQVTNSDFDLAFGMDYKVELVTMCGTVLSDVTDRFFMSQFIHQQTGIINQYWECIQLTIAYSMPVHFKISHWAGGVPLSSLVIYSNPFYISANKKGAKMHTYWDTGVRFGIDYATTTAKCRIRTRGRFMQLKPETPDETYTQVSSQDGNGIMIMKHSDDVLIPRTYIVEYCENHGVKCFEYFRKHGVTYIDDVRATTISQDTGDVLGNSNFYTGNRKAYMNESEIWVDSFQVAPNFALVSFSPTGVYTADTFPETLTGTFNYDIFLGEGTLSIYSPEGERLANFNQDDISVVNNIFSINIAPLMLGIGNYYVNFVGSNADELFKNMFRQSVSLTDNTTWTFSIANNRYDGDRYDLTRYL